MEPVSSKPWSALSQPGLKLSLALFTGTVSYSGHASEAFADGTASGFEMGCRVHRWHLNFSGGRAPTSLRRDFAQRSGYPLSYLELHGWAWIIQGGYTLFDRYGLRFTPTIGLRWDELTEHHTYYDRHPNWNLDAQSNAQPMVSARFDFNVGRGERKRDVYRLLYWLFFRVSATRFDFNNPEYGEGTAFEVGFGFGVDWLVWRGVK
jgi:hypothetical protein